jgi:hypothetical protein
LNGPEGPLDTSGAKGVFPYELLTKNTLIETLLKSEPFERKDFWSDLTKATISEERYQ